MLIQLLIQTRPSKQQLRIAVHYLGSTVSFAACFRICSFFVFTDKTKKKSCPGIPLRFSYKSVCPVRALLSAPVPTWARAVVSAFSRPSLQLLKSVCFFLPARFFSAGRRDPRAEEIEAGQGHHQAVHRRPGRPQDAIFARGWKGVRRPRCHRDAGELKAEGGQEAG